METYFVSSLGKMKVNETHPKVFDLVGLGCFSTLRGCPASDMASWITGNANVFQQLFMVTPQKTSIMYCISGPLRGEFTDDWRIPSQRAAYDENIFISMAYRKTAVTPLLMHWSYCSLVLSHWFHVDGCRTPGLEWVTAFKPTPAVT